MSETERKCETCKYWDADNACPANERLRIRYDENYDNIVPPHADLRWSECAAAVMGFENDNEEEEANLYGGKMAVFDGSAYFAVLYTRFDHICGEFQPKKEGERDG